MLTFLELYQTLLGFVLFKLYADAGLVYPPPVDKQKDEGAAGVGAFHLQDTSTRTVASPAASKGAIDIDGRKISGKDVRKTIKSIDASFETKVVDLEMLNVLMTDEMDEEFIDHPSTSETRTTTSLPTMKSLATLPPTLSTALFAPYTFFLSRETSRPIFEFIIRSFGGRIGWPASLGSGSPFGEDDDSITHVIIDRPLVERINETALDRDRRLGRKFVQPQWIVDCINSGKILLEEPYAQGKTLPPHLSPFGESEGAYDPAVGISAEGARLPEDEAESEKDESVEGGVSEDLAHKIALTGVAAAEDANALRAAELTAEAAGVEYGMFEKEVGKLRNKSTKTSGTIGEESELDMNKMMMSNKQRKLYEKMKYSQKKRESQVR